MHSLEPIAADKFKKFLERCLCEARGSRYGRAIYWRFDPSRPISFQEEGLVPVTQIRISLRTLQVTVEKYLSILDSLFPSDAFKDSEKEI